MTTIPTLPYVPDSEEALDLDFNLCQQHAETAGRATTLEDILQDFRAKRNPRAPSSAVKTSGSRSDASSSNGHRLSTAETSYGIHEQNRLEVDVTSIRATAASESILWGVGSHTEGTSHRPAIQSKTESRSTSWRKIFMAGNGLAALVCVHILCRTFQQIFHGEIYQMEAQYMILTTTIACFVCSGIHSKLRLCEGWEIAIKMGGALIFGSFLAIVAHSMTREGPTHGVL